MKPRIRDRATRMIVASLINSDLTVRELAEAAQLFASDRSFTLDVGRVLRQAADGLGRQAARSIDTTKGQSSRAGDDDPVAQAIRIIKRRRIPKRELLSLIEQVYPSLRFTSAAIEMTVDEILHHALESDESRTLSMLIDRLLAEGQKPDEYLQGIMGRGEGKG